MSTFPPLALVTGANRGLGLEVCRQLVQQGYQVLLAARDPAKAAAAAKALQSVGLPVEPLVCDVANPTSIAQAAAQVEARHGRLDVLINNAAICYDDGQHPSTTSLPQVEAAMQTNLYGPWRMCQALLPLLRQSPHPRIVNVSSEVGSFAYLWGSVPAYATSKIALNALTRNLALELKGTGILVNAVCPGWSQTDMGNHGGRPVADGAASIIWAANLPDDGPTGGFFRDGQPLPW